MGRNKKYADSLTKDYLLKVGITEVSKDGKTLVMNGKLINLNEKAPDRAGYLYLTIYDKALYDVLYPLTKQPNCGTVKLHVHRIVYAWFNNYIPNNYVIDHKDNNRLNNAVDNLQLLTPAQNTWKDREHDTRKVMSKSSREHVQSKLDNYKMLYEQAKLDHDSKACHTYRSCIAAYKARLRYLDEQ